MNAINVKIAVLGQKQWQYFMHTPEVTIHHHKNKENEVSENPSFPLQMKASYKEQFQPAVSFLFLKLIKESSVKILYNYISNINKK